MAADIFKRILGSKCSELECISCVRLTCQGCGFRPLVHAGNRPFSTRVCVPCPRCSVMVEVTEDAMSGKQADVYVIKRAEVPTREDESATDFTKESTVVTEIFADGTDRTCDVCSKLGVWHEQRYCDTCKQKLCTDCCGIHKRMSVTRHHSLSDSYPECTQLGSTLVQDLQSMHGSDLEALSEHLHQLTGLQICFNVSHETIEICAPTVEILELAVLTLQKHDKSPPRNGVDRRVVKGGIEWVFHGDSAVAVDRLFQEEISAVKEICDEVYMSVSERVSVYTPSRRDDSPQRHPTTRVQNYGSDIQAIADKILKKRTVENAKTEVNSKRSLLLNSFAANNSNNDDNDTDNDVVKTVRCSFDEYHVVCEIMDAIESEILSLQTEVIVRPRGDLVRLAIFATVKRNDLEVICSAEQLNDDMIMLKMKSRFKDKLNDARAEFLSLYCRECCKCQCDTINPAYLECKHVLCHDCFNQSIPTAHSRNTCPLCQHTSGSIVTPLQLLALQALNHLLDNSKSKHEEQNAKRPKPRQVYRKQPIANKRVHSTKIPKYLLNKWKRASGGIRRLKSMIENDFGLHVTGSDDNLRLYGEQQELLDLAIASLDARNEETPDTGLSRRLSNKSVEWRFRGDFARIIRFLFKEELFELPNKFKSVTLRVFTESKPSIVDIRCNYEEYSDVNFEMEELENAIKSLLEDEYIQPKTFYYNVNISEFIHAKRRDERVFCEQVVKNNRNAVVIKARKKEYIQAAKEELVKW